MVGATTGPDTPTVARFPLEVAAVWALYAVVTVEIVTTYSRLPSEETYHVSRSGLAGGLSRAVVFWNWPLALVAIAVLAFLAERLATRTTTGVAVAGIALCAVIVWPGVVEQSNLDAKGVNAVPALGVLVAIALSAYAAWRLEQPGRLRWQPWDRLRIATAVAVLLLGIPWLAADLGFSLDDVPLLGSIYQTSEIRTEPGRAGAHPAVHAGHHHGMTGVLFVLSALLLSRLVPAVAKQWLRGVLAVYVALMFWYGADLFANDFWLEQIVKRYWTDRSIPSAINPAVSVIWGVIVAVTLALWCVTVWLRRRSPASRMDR